MPCVFKMHLWKLLSLTMRVIKVSIEARQDEIWASLALTMSWQNTTVLSGEVTAWDTHFLFNSHVLCPLKEDWEQLSCVSLPDQHHLISWSRSNMPGSEHHRCKLFSRGKLHSAARRLWAFRLPENVYETLKESKLPASRQALELVIIMLFDPRTADCMTQQEYYKYNSKDRWGQSQHVDKPVTHLHPASASLIATLWASPQQWRSPVSAMANDRLTTAGHFKAHVTSIELSFWLCSKQPIRAACGFVPE